MKERFAIDHEEILYPLSSILGDDYNGDDDVVSKIHVGIGMYMSIQYTHKTKSQIVTKRKVNYPLSFQVDNTIGVSRHF